MAFRSLIQRLSLKRAFESYREKYIETDSIQPLYHVCFGGMALFYFIALPEELRHLEHAKHEKEKAASH